ncbi:sigma-70 family RNA polymerase sigma factor [Bacillus timonensis]|nr:sigma-70 family RNA polymerase sigma factor [Bacillus timonensis]
MSSDESIIQGILTGQTDLFKIIVSRYQHKVISVALKVTPNQKDAEDIAQEVFIQVYKSLENFKGSASFSTWIYRITMNKALDFKRKQSNIKQMNINESYHLQDYSSLLPEAYILQKGEQETIRNLISKLPERYQSVVQLYYMEECTYKEIGDRLGIATKTVESRLYRAKALLKDICSKEGIR